MTLHDAKIELILQVTQALRVGINHRDIVVFTHQIFCQGSANLSCAQNDYFHRLSILISVCTRFFYQLSVEETISALGFREDL